MRGVAPDTLEKIISAIPDDVPASTVDIWRGSGGVSHQQVKNALGRLVAAGRVLRLETRKQNSLRAYYKRAGQ